MPNDNLAQKISPSCEEMIILDFETTGLSSQNDRVIEVGALLIKNHKIIDEFVELMNPGITLSSFITSLTGISNAMLKGKPKPEHIMPKLLSFIGDRPIVAHNASFDKRFLIAEMDRAKLSFDNPFVCTMLLAKRLLPEASSYKLANIARHVGIRVNSQSAHRALSDTKVTAKLWKHLHSHVIKSTGNHEPSIATLTGIMSKRVK